MDSKSHPLKGGGNYLRRKFSALPLQGRRDNLYKHTEDSLAKMRNFVLSDEVRKIKASSTANASAANRVPIIVENIKTNEISEYISMTEASKVLGVHKNAVGQAISNSRLIKKTYRVTKKISDLNN